MGKKLLLILGVFALFATGLVKSGRVRRDITDMVISDEERQSLLNLFNTNPVVIRPDQIPKLMHLMHEGLLSIDLKQALAIVVLKPVEDQVKNEIKRKLDDALDLTLKEQPVAWALYTTNDLSDGQKAQYEKQRTARLPPVEIEDVSDTEVKILKDELNNGTRLTDEQRSTLIKEADDLDPLEIAKLADSITVTDADKTAILKLVRTGALLTMDEQVKFWTMKAKNMVPDTDMPTRKGMEEEAMNLVKNLTVEQKTELRVKLVNSATVLTDDELMKVSALEKVMEFTKAERDEVARRKAAKIDDEKMNKIKIAIEYGDMRPQIMEMIRYLVKAGKLTSTVLKRVEDEGMMPNGEPISAAFTEGAPIPDSYGLTDQQKRTIREIGTRLKDVLNFDEVETKEDILELIEDFGELSEDDRNIIGNFTNIATSLTKEEIRHFNTKIIEKIPEAKLKEAYSSMDTEQKKAMCALGIGAVEGKGDLFKKLYDLCADSVSTETQDMEKGGRARLAERMLETIGNPTEITGDDLQKFATAGLVTAKTLARIRSEDLLANHDVIAAALENKEDDIVRKKLREAKGGTFASVTKSELENMRGMALLPSDLDEIPDSVVAEAADALLEGIHETDTARREKIAKKIKNTITTDVNAADAAQLASLVQAGATEIMEQLTDDKMTTVMTQLATKTLDKKAKRAIGKKITEMSEFRDPTAMTANKINQVKDYLGELTGFFMEKVPDSAVTEALNAGNTKDIKDMDRGTARKFAKVATEANIELTVTNVMNKMGGAVMSAMDMSRLPAETARNEGVLNLLETVADKMAPTNRQALIDMIKPAIRSTVSICKIGQLCRDLTPQDADAFPVAVISDIIAAETCNLNCDRSVLAVLAKKMIELLGEPGETNTNYDKERWEKLGFLMAGLSVDMMEKMPVNSNTPSIISKMLRADDLSDTKRKKLIEKVKARFTTNKPTTEAEVADMAPALSEYDEAKLTRDIPAEFCGEAVKGLAAMKFETVEATVLEGQAKYALNCKTGQTSGAINSDAATALGDLICYLPSERVSDLTTAAVNDIASTIQDCPFTDAAARKPFKDKLMEGMPPFSSMTKELVAKIIFALQDFLESEFSQMPTNVKSSILDDVATTLELIEEELTDREMAQGEGIDVEAARQRFIAVVRELIGARIQELEAAAAATRKKRDTNSPLQCSDIQSAGMMAVAFTVAQLHSLTDAVILECMTTLGADIPWSQEQKTALAARLKTAGIHGTDLTQWSSAQIQDSGSMMGGFTETELGQFSWTTADLSVHGSYKSTWASSQLAAVISKWLQSVKGNDASTITAAELNVIGHFTCGLTVSHINSMSNTVYQNAVAKIGQAEGCSVDQAKAFADKAKAVYNGVQTWTTETVISVNRVLAGLTGTELSSLQTSHLVEILPTTIAILPSNTLSGLTATQIKALSKSQALAVTLEQYSAFNPSQRQAWVSVSGKQYTMDSGAGIQEMSLIPGLLVVMVTIFMI